MSEGTSFDTNVYIPRGIYNSMWELKAEIDDLNDSINRCEESLLMYAIATPKDIVDVEENGDVVNYIKEEIKGIVETIKQDVARKNYLILFQEHLEEHPEKDIMEYNPYKDLKNDTHGTGI